MCAGVTRHYKVDRPEWGGRNGIEPSSPGWSPGALPWLCYSRVRRVNDATKLLHGPLLCQYYPDSPDGPKVYGQFAASQFGTKFGTKRFQSAANSSAKSKQRTSLS